MIALCIAALGSALGLLGCRVDENDVHRWEGTVQGPKKLCAVLLHDKYETSLRVESALAIIRMKPRSGRRLAFTQIDSDVEAENPTCKGSLVDVLSALEPEAQKAIVGPLVSSIIVELKKPPPVYKEGEPIPTDGSIPYKDAAYALLMADKPVLISDEAQKKDLKIALTEWAMADFEHRLEARGQASSMDQVLRAVGSEAVAGLPKLMVRDARKLGEMSILVADIGDEKAKEAASAALVEAAQWVLGEDWAKVRTKELEKQNADQKLTPTPEQFKKQLETLQDDELMKLFQALRRVGGRPAVDFALGFAARKDQSDKRRQTALAALDATGKPGKPKSLDKSNPDDVKRLVEIAGSDAPDVVLDQAFRRLGEMPREVVADKLYGLFKTDKWKVRRAAAATLLKLSNVKHIGEFLKALPDGKPFAMGEALTYGALLGELKEGKPLDELKPFMNSGTPAARTSAIAYYFTYGTSAELPDLAPLLVDGEWGPAPAPSCDTDPECKWICEVPKEGEQGREQKEIKTISDFVRYCIQPAMKERKPEAGKEQKK
ncbi:MAG: HEAT repeat domain-containing protein [Polyangiaceae bacterium]|nr:HEAT repeat domain-containing protein [Polyangiaceae bacterium]